MPIKNGDVFYNDSSDTFNIDSIDDAVGSLIESDSTISNGDIITIESGEVKLVSVSRFIPDIFEHMAEHAYDDYGDLRVDFPDKCIEIEKGIQAEVESLIVKLFDKHNLNPNFCDIINTKEIKVKIINVDRCEFELVEVDYAKN